MEKTKKKNDDIVPEEEYGLAYGKTKYWDDRYHRDGQSFDWLQRWIDFHSRVDQYLPRDGGPILNVGCGLSRLAEDMAAEGYKEIISIDISKVAIDKKCEDSLAPSLKFYHMNACALTFPDESFDGAICKATFDIMMCSQGAGENVRRSCKEVSRVLRPGAAFLVISYDLSIQSYLEPQNTDLDWSLEHLHLPRPRLPTTSSDTKEDPHHLFICRKNCRAVEKKASSEKLLMVAAAASPSFRRKQT